MEGTNDQAPVASGVKFGPFELLVETGELRKDGQRLKLSGQPIQVLARLVAEPGKLVTREELQAELWPGSSYGDFEKGLNAAVNRLRENLGDTATAPQYIETIPRRGYRFIGEVQLDGPQGGRSTARKGWMVLAAVVIMALAGVSLGLPVMARHYNNRGVALQRDGRVKEAIDSYQRALSLKPSYAEAHYNLADAYEELPAYDKALEEYQKAIETDPTLYEAYNNLARLYIKRRKEPEAALDLLQRGINLNPQEPSVQYSLYKNLGWANFELHLWGQTEANLRRAITLDPSRGAAHCLLARVLDVQESPGSAFKEWELCAAYCGQGEVEPEWCEEAKEHVNKEAQK